MTTRDRADSAPALASYYFPSRIALQTVDRAMYSYVLIDAWKLNGINWGQLAGYVSMTVLAHPELGASCDDKTILSLFSERDAGRAPPRALTSLGRSFLTALYRSDAAQTAGRQRNEIRRALGKDLATIASGK